MKDFLVVICAAFLFMGAAVGLLQLAEDHFVATAPQSTPAPSLGDELIFPDGWTLVLCETYLKTDGYRGCHYVCVKDSVYRYCTPEIKTVDADQSQDGIR